MNEHDIRDFPRQPGERLGDYYHRMLTDPAVADHVGAESAGMLVEGAEYCRRWNCRPAFGGTKDLWGYGDAPVAYVDEDGDWQIHLVDLIDPVGLGYRRLTELAEQMAGEDAEYDSQGHTVRRHGDRWVVTSVGVMRLFMCHSPWAAEWYDAVRPLMTHAMIHSRLLDALGPVPTYRIDVAEDGEQVAVPAGESFADTVTRDLPSLEVARHQAVQGPFGALRDGES